MKQYRVLITAGGTAEPIDAVRVISNVSTGKTGAFLADYFTNAGFEVVLVKSLYASEPVSLISKVAFSSFASLDHVLRDTLSVGYFDAVIHAAAVSDYTVDYLVIDGKRVRPDKHTKLDSKKNLSIILKPTFKIINKIKTYGSIGKLVGFKLTNTLDKKKRFQEVKSLLNQAPVDIVVHNDKNEIFGDTHTARIFNSQGHILAHTETKADLASKLIEIIRAQKIS